MRRCAVAAIALIFAQAGSALAHGEGEFVFGAPGHADQVVRTVDVIMTDHAYSAATIDVADGETVRFVVRNRGEVVHEFNIWTPDMHQAHGDEMLHMFERGMMDETKINMAAMHDDPNSLLLEPGQDGEIVCTFKAASGVHFACNVPGHFDAGMHGEINF